MKNVNKKEKQKNAQLLSELKSKNAHSAIVDKKITDASHVNTSVSKKENEERNTTVADFTKQTKRDVKAFAVVATDKQSAYERRFYMRNFHNNEDETVVRHKTSHTIEEMTKQMLTFLVTDYEKKSVTRKVTTSEIVRITCCYGPSYTDVIRNSAKKLQQLKLIKIHNIANERSRAKYAYELNADNINKAKEFLSSFSQQKRE